MRRTPAALLGLVAVLAGAACGKKPAAPRPPADFDVGLDTRDDCLHHAAALVALSDDALLAFGACGHTGEGSEAAGEEIVAVRLDGRGLATPPQPVEILEAGWATNLVAAPVRGGGAVVGWTAAVARRANAFLAPVDEQGRPAGEPSPMGAGRAAALAAGPQGAALALITEPDSLSDDDPGAGVGLELVVVDANAKEQARAKVSRRVEAAHAQAALAGDPDGYVLVWSEAGVLTATRVDAAGQVGARGAILPDPTTLGLEAGVRFGWPALTLGKQGSARVVAIVELPTGATEIWRGEGTIGAPESAWKWKRLVAAGTARRARLAMVRGADDSELVAWSEGEGGQDFPAVFAVRVDAAGALVGAPEKLADGAVYFDGSVAAARLGRSGVIAAAQPPGASGAPGALRVVQKIAR